MARRCGGDPQSRCPVGMSSVLHPRTCTDPGKRACLIRPERLRHHVQAHRLILSPMRSADPADASSGVLKPAGLAVCAIGLDPGLSRVKHCSLCGWVSCFGGVACVDATERSAVILGFWNDRLQHKAVRLQIRAESHVRIAYVDVALAGDVADLARQELSDPNNPFSRASISSFSTSMPSQPIRSMICGTENCGTRTTPSGCPDWDHRIAIRPV